MSNEPSHTPKRTKRKAKKIAAWVLPASVVSILGLGASIVFFPFGIIAFILAIGVIAFNVLREETLETDNAK